MKINQIVETQDISEAWDIWFNFLAKQELNESSRDGEIAGELINAITIINDPTKNILNNDKRKLSMRYALGEFLWYMSGNNELRQIQKYTSNWNRMSDDGVTVNSNYGYCIKHKFGFDQWEFVKNELKQNPNSRRAVIHIKEATDKQSADVNCTVSLQFLIREDKLFLITYMRSNDIWLGFPYDVFNFCNYQVLMSMELGVELGSYQHIAGSLHLYKRDLDKFNEGMCLTF